MAFKYADDSDSEFAGMTEVSGKVIRTTLRAILFDDGVSQQWLPLSKIKVGSEDKSGVVTVCLPEWLAKEKKYT